MNTNWLGEREFKLTFRRSPQSVVTVFVTSKPAPTQGKEDGKENLINHDQNKQPAVKKFTIHKDFICFYSPFFTSAFNGPYKEGQTQSMTLYEVDPEVFGMFVYWIYNRKLPNTTEGSELVNLLHLAKLWVLGDRFLIPSLQNKAIFRIHTIINEGRVCKFMEFMNLAYNYREGHNQLAKMAAWTIAWGHKDFFDGVYKQGGFPAAMAIDVMTVLKEHHEGLAENLRLKMPENQQFAVKEYKG
jgi:hypothetical protein